MCAVNIIKPYKVMFGMEAFQSLGVLDTAYFEDELEDLFNLLELLHHYLHDEGRNSRSRTKSKYDKWVNKIVFKEEDQLLLWLVELSKSHGNKIMDWAV